MLLRSPSPGVPAPRAPQAAQTGVLPRAPQPSSLFLRPSPLRPANPSPRSPSARPPRPPGVGVPPPRPLATAQPQGAAPRRARAELTGAGRRGCGSGEGGPEGPGKGSGHQPGGAFHTDANLFLGLRMVNTSQPPVAGIRKENHGFSLSESCALCGEVITKSDSS